MVARCFLAGLTLLMIPVWGQVDSVAGAQTVGLELSAGGHERIDVVVAVDLPASLLDAPALHLERIDVQPPRAVAVQKTNDDPPRACWIARGRLPAGVVRRYRLGAAPEVADTDGGVVCRDDGKALWFSVRGRKVVRYNHEVVQPPAGIDPIYARSGYLHPLWSPAGRVISGDFPPAHKHHHGIWFPWTRTLFEGKETDFWNSGASLGRIEFVVFDSFRGGPVFGHLEARQQHLALKTASGPKVVLNERWQLRVYALEEVFVFDLISDQRCASDEPLFLKQYRYGGLGFRGSIQWEGPHVSFLTSEGRTRKDGHATRADWCAIYGLVDSQPAGIAVMCHPENFRAPQPMRIHPSEPFFNFTPCQLGDFAIEPGKPYVSRYRFVVFDGKVDPALCRRLWNDYAHPPVVGVQ